MLIFPHDQKFPWNQLFSKFFSTMVIWRKKCWFFPHAQKFPWNQLIISNFFSTMLLWRKNCRFSLALKNFREINSLVTSLVQRWFGGKNVDFFVKWWSCFWQLFHAVLLPLRFYVKSKNTIVIHLKASEFIFSCNFAFFEGWYLPKWKVQSIWKCKKLHFLKFQNTKKWFHIK